MKIQVMFGPYEAPPKYQNLNKFLTTGSIFDLKVLLYRAHQYLKLFGGNPLGVTRETLKLIFQNSNE